jgi:UDP-N-acetylmuramate: L-alanyl-gamma-D-glutamyl-meso-diaminopimelate ligase
MRIHIIAIGGRIMHSLALILQKHGHQVSGSDDEIYEPSRTKLKKAGLLPEKEGWDSSRILDDIDLVILGMHAKADNPELIVAQSKGISVMSYPEYIYQCSKDKKRIVVAGSHGKTTTTAMIMHVLKYRNIEFDYLIGAELDGFDSMIRLSYAPLIILEGDEYLSSCIDRRPKMQHYFPSMSIITGVSWDHVNVFKTEDEYIELFDWFIETHEADAPIYYYEEDVILRNLAKKHTSSKDVEPYLPLNRLANGNIIYDNKQYKIKVFGKHNRANMMAALQVCLKQGITAPDFFAAISSFKGASKRMELFFENENSKVYRDFAHAPSKVKATVAALKENFPDKKIITFLELHTFSSLNQDFLPKYSDSLADADEAYVFYSAHTLEIKNMPFLKTNLVIDAFNRRDLKVINEREALESELENLNLTNSVVVFMSSGNFDKIDLKGILINKL